MHQLILRSLFSFFILFASQATMAKTISKPQVKVCVELKKKYISSMYYYRYLNKKSSVINTKIRSLSAYIGKLHKYLRTINPKKDLKKYVYIKGLIKRYSSYLSSLNKEQRLLKSRTYQIYKQILYIKSLMKRNRC